MIAVTFRDVAGLVVLAAAFAGAIGYLIGLVRKAIHLQDDLKRLSSQTLDAVTPGNGGITATLADIRADIARLDQKLNQLKENPNA